MAEVVTYWQVYAVLAASGLAAYWAGWACCSLAYRPRARHAHRGRRAAAVPAALPAAPPVAAAALEAAHANVMARAAPHAPPPLARATVSLAALRATLAMATVTSYIMRRWALDRSGGRPWRDATGTFPTVVLELDQDTAA